MLIYDNPYRGTGLGLPGEMAASRIAVDPAPVLGLLGKCPSYVPTPLASVDELARRCGASSFHVKDERARMGLGSFKALGAAYVIAREATAAAETAAPDALHAALAGRTFVAASAGNHGMSVAAGARLFGAEAVIFLSETVSRSIANRLAAKGARIVREGADYEASMAAAERAAAENGWTLLSDSSWPGYTDPALRVMEGYLAMGAEIAGTLDERPTHIVLQAGVGGFAASLAAFFRARWGEDPVIVVAEPAFAPCLARSIDAGGPVRADGPVSSMGRLDCKEPSHLALAGLSRDADRFAVLEEEEVAETVSMLADLGLSTTPSGAAGIAAALRLRETGLDIGPESRLLTVVTEAG